MRTIKKERAPRLLETYGQSDGSTFENLPGNVKEQIQFQLVREQRGLCCYCQSRIRATWDGMKVEHWKSQSPDKYPELQLDYSNMLGACAGGQKYGQKSPRENQHCDTLKGDSDLCFSVCDPAHPIERKIRFLGNGEITSDDEAVRTAVNEVLNLNLSRLKENRKSALTGFLQGLGNTKLDHARELPKWDGSLGTELSPFSQIIAHYLLKKMKRLST